MQSRSLDTYIYFGASFRYLQDARDGWTVHGEGFIVNNLDAFFNYLDELNLVVTERAAYDLRRITEELRQRPAGHLLTEAEAASLQEEMQLLSRTLYAEAEGNVAYIVADKRMDVTKLVGNVPALFAPNVFDALDEIARDDFDEAGKCIAFELPTAAAFHLLRGCESVLRQFYLATVQRNRIDPLMWGPMVTHLEGRRRPPPAELLANLDNIRRHFRNPTQHPDKSYDIDEAQDLFSLCVDVVNRMAKFL